MRSGLRSVLGAVGIKPKEKEPNGWYWLDTYPIEDFWGSPTSVYYIKEQALVLEAWYVVELRVMRERVPKKDIPKTCREYIVATVARTETKDPTGNGFLTFERVKHRKPTTGWDPRGAHPDRKREREIFEEGKPIENRPSDEDFAKYKDYVSNARLRYMHVDRVRISARPWLYDTDETVAILRLPPPDLDADDDEKTPTNTTATPRAFAPGSTTTQPKCKWLYVWELVYIAMRLNHSRELFQVFPNTCHWLPGMTMHIVRVWTGSVLELVHRDKKHTVQIQPGQDMLEWFERQQKVLQQRQKQKDREKEDYSDVIRIIKTPRNNTIRALVEEYWRYADDIDGVLTMFRDIELQELQRQKSLNQQFAADLDKVRKKTEERVQRIYEQKDREIAKQQEMRARQKALADARQRKVRMEGSSTRETRERKPEGESAGGPSGTELKKVTVEAPGNKDIGRSKQDYPSDDCSRSSWFRLPIKD